MACSSRMLFTHIVNHKLLQNVTVAELPSALSACASSSGSSWKLLVGRPTALLSTAGTHGYLRPKARAPFHIISFHLNNLWIDGVSFHFHLISFDLTSFRLISFHFVWFHVISFHLISVHLLSWHFHLIWFYLVSFHVISFHLVFSLGLVSSHLISTEFI
jgi:hypothetical protein